MFVHFSSFILSFCARERYVGLAAKCVYDYRLYPVRSNTLHQSCDVRL